MNSPLSTFPYNQNIMIVGQSCSQTRVSLFSGLHESQIRTFFLRSSYSTSGVSNLCSQNIIFEHFSGQKESIKSCKTNLNFIRKKKKKRWYSLFLLNIHVSFNITNTNTWKIINIFYHIWLLYSGLYDYLVLGMVVKGTKIHSPSVPFSLCRFSLSALVSFHIHRHMC